jgi:hypothetical protein
VSDDAERWRDSHNAAPPSSASTFRQPRSRQHEHGQLPWRMFQMLVKRDDGDWHRPDKPWLPLALSLQATPR